LGVPLLHGCPNFGANIRKGPEIYVPGSEKGAMKNIPRPQGGGGMAAINFNLCF